jgi:uncharacterized membrane protein YfcA
MEWGVGDLLWTPPAVVALAPLPPHVARATGLTVLVLLALAEALHTSQTCDEVMRKASP